jgi:hypothetical protein
MEIQKPLEGNSCTYICSVIRPCWNHNHLVSCVTRIWWFLSLSNIISVRLQQWFLT